MDAATDNGFWKCSSLAAVRRATKTAAKSPVAITNGAVLQRAIARTVGLQEMRERERERSLPPGWRMLLPGKTYASTCLIVTSSTERKSVV